MAYASSSSSGSTETFCLDAFLVLLQAGDTSNSTQHSSTRTFVLVIHEQTFVHAIYFTNLHCTTPPTAQKKTRWPPMRGACVLHHGKMAGPKEQAKSGNACQSKGQNMPVVDILIAYDCTNVVLRRRTCHMLAFLIIFEGGQSSNT